MNKIQQNALKLHEKIMALKLGDDRLKECLKPPSQKYTESWHVCLPSCFNDSLDIKLFSMAAGPTWTQGAFFSFSEGDVLYDKKEGYLVWSEALKCISFSIQITRATPVVSTPQDNALAPGLVEFTLYKPDKNRAKIEPVEHKSMTQDEFVRFLICGEIQRSVEDIGV